MPSPAACTRTSGLCSVANSTRHFKRSWVCLVEDGWHLGVEAFSDSCASEQSYIVWQVLVHCADQVVDHPKLDANHLPSETGEQPSGQIHPISAVVACAAACTPLSVRPHRVHLIFSTLSFSAIELHCLMQPVLTCETHN